MKYCFDYDYDNLKILFSDYYVVKSIHELICKDDNSGVEAYNEQGEPIFDDGILALDLDAFERAFAENKSKPSPSMDMGFFVGCDELKRALVLVEMRFNFSKFSNISKDDLDKKVDCSKNRVQCYLKESIYPKKYFLFAKNKVQQGKNRLQRMNPKCSQDYQAIGVCDLYQLFFKDNQNHI